MARFNQRRVFGVSCFMLCLFGFVYEPFIAAHFGTGMAAGK